MRSRPTTAAGSWKELESYRRAVKLAEQCDFELRIEELERRLGRRWPLSKR